MNVGMTVYSQPKDSSRICLTYPQFDFYAQTLVEKEGLMVDTMILSRQIKLQDKTINNLDRQLSIDMEIMNNKDHIIDTQKKSFDDLSIKYNKQGKKVKRLKVTSLVFAVTTFVLGLLVLIK